MAVPPKNIAVNGRVFVMEKFNNMNHIKENFYSIKNYVIGLFNLSFWRAVKCTHPVSRMIVYKRICEECGEQLSEYRNLD